MNELRCKECHANLILRDSRFYCVQCGLESDLQKFGSKESRYTYTAVLNGTVIGNRKERWNPQVINLRRTHARYCGWIKKTCIICHRTFRGRQIKYCLRCRANEYRRMRRESCRRWYYKHPQEARDRSQEWRNKNPEKVRIASQRYNLKNREKIKIHNKEYYQKNRKELLMKRRERYWKGK